MTCWKPWNRNIRKRRFASVVQLEIYESMPQPIRNLLIENLEIRLQRCICDASPAGPEQPVADL